jgi:hypothetical protein
MKCWCKSEFGQSKTSGCELSRSALLPTADIHVAAATFALCLALMHRSKKRSYSITSSARPSSEIGTLTPNVAVLRLIISSTFVDCMTGKSAGLSPLRTLPT